MILPYLLDDNQYRPPMGAAGNFAIHYYPLRILRFELLATVGNPSNQPLYATRPVAILDLGWLKLKAGTEYQHQHDPTQSDNLSYTTKKGVGGAIQFVFQPHVEFGLNAAQGTVKSVDATGDWQRTNQSFYADQLRRLRQRLQRRSQTSAHLRRGRGVHPHGRSAQYPRQWRGGQVLAVAELRGRPIRCLPAALHQAGRRLLQGPLAHRRDTAAHLR